MDYRWLEASKELAPVSGMVVEPLVHFLPAVARPQEICFKERKFERSVFGALLVDVFGPGSSWVTRKSRRDIHNDLKGIALMHNDSKVTKKVAEKAECVVELVRARKAKEADAVKTATAEAKKHRGKPMGVKECLQAVSRWA